MKLLVITQKVSETDSILGFMIGWLAALAERVITVEVICLEQGAFNLPANVRVWSLGKERNRGRLIYLLNFYRLIWRRRRHYDAVWVHMNQLYVLLGAPVWRFLGKPVVLWYAHGRTSFSLILAEKLANLITTSSPAGFRLKSQKIRILGQGIDVSRFRPTAILPAGGPLRLVTVGRLSPVKDYETIFRAIANLPPDLDWRLEIIGGAVMPADAEYENHLRQLARILNIDQQVIWSGALPQADLPARLQAADIFITMSRTGSLDKTVLEAMAVGRPVLVGNEAYQPVLGPLASELMVKPGDDADLTMAIKRLAAFLPADRQKLGERLRQAVINDHSLDNLMTRLVRIIEQLCFRSQ